MGKSDNGAAIHALGLIDLLCTRDTLLHEKQDSVAMALNEDYRKRYEGDEWDKLTEEFRDSNCLAADHIPIKLRVLKLRITEKGEGEPADLTLFKTPKDENEVVDTSLVLMAKMEHSRWCTEKWLLGWRFGEVKEKDKKINPDLVSWEDLNPEERKKDLEQIRTIPDALDKAGKMIISAKL